MNKKKTSKKRGFSLDDLPVIKVKKGIKLIRHDPSRFFKNKNNVGVALLECLIDNDVEAFIEIINAFLSVNGKRVPVYGKIDDSEIWEPFSKKRSNNLKTIAKVIHQSIKQ